MKAYTYIFGAIVEGLELTTDFKLGQLLQLGQRGLGAHYWIFTLNRQTPPQVINGRVFECDTGTIEVVPRDKFKQPFTAYNLLRSAGISEKILLRVNTFGDWVSSKSLTGGGYWEAVSGRPDKIAYGHGPIHADDLLVMSPGDVLWVQPSGENVPPYAVFFKDGAPVTMLWEQYQRQEKKSILLSNKPEVISTLATCCTYQKKIGRQTSDGIDLVHDNVLGRVMMVGSFEARGCRETLIPTNLSQQSQLLKKVAVIKSGGVVWLSDPVHVSSKPVEAILVQVKLPACGGGFKPLPGRTGTALFMGNGYRKSDCGKFQTEDQLWLLKNEEAICATAAPVRGTSDPRAGRVLANIGGKLQEFSKDEWELRDARMHPQEYINTGIAPFPDVPREWVGREVKILDSYSAEKVGILLAIKPQVVVDLRSEKIYGREWQAKEETVIDKANWVLLSDNEVMNPTPAEVVDMRIKQYYEKVLSA